MKYGHIPVSSAPMYTLWNHSHSQGSSDYSPEIETQSFCFLSAWFDFFQICGGFFFIVIIKVNHTYE